MTVCTTDARHAVRAGRGIAPCARDRTPSTPAMSAFVLPMTGSSVSSTRSDTCRPVQAGRWQLLCHAGAP